MLKAGEPAIVSSRPAAQAWDGRRLPGPWLTLRALDTAMAMAATHGTGTVTIRRSHHIACLAAYLTRATERGLIAIIQSSDPFVAAVVPHGGLTPFITPNPLAAGLPTVITTAVHEGLPAGIDRGCIVADEPAAFAAAVVRLLRMSPEARRSMAAASDVDRFDWPALLAPVRPILEHAARGERVIATGGV